MIKKKYFLIIYFIIVISNIYSSISTSRPGAANPTAPVPERLLQFEFGCNSSLEGNELIFPSLTRLGLFKHTELQLYYTDEIITYGLLIGGFQTTDKLENSIILTSSENSETYLYTPISYSISDDLAVWGQLSSLLPSGDSDSYISYALAVGGNINEKIGWFGEVYGTPSNDISALDGGLTYLINNQTQIDLSAGISLDDNQTKFLELGFAFRIPK
tara:strand:+ start:1082 stop:1729 length:648 start_codon:yes stop_codon:yes gene_type:complete